jgi:hypothetical protein
MIAVGGGAVVMMVRRELVGEDVVSVR